LVDKKGFWEEWRASEPANSAIMGLFKRAVEYLGITVDWHVKVYEPEEDDKVWGLLDAVSEIQYGNVAYFIMNRNMADGVPEQGKYQAIVALHEVLHVLLWDHDHLHEKSFDDGENLGELLEELRHITLDRLAWRLLPHVYPDLKPEEDYFEAVEDLDSTPLGVDIGIHAGGTVAGS
jgi:hypothetical protein